MFKIGLADTHFCECGEVQPAAHILMECQLYTNKREIMLKVIQHSFIKYDIPIHEHSLNLTNLLWPQLTIHHCSYIIIS